MPFDKASLLWNLTWDADWTTAVTFIGNTKRLAAGNNLGEILLWDLPEKASARDPAPLPSLQFVGHTNCITRLISTRDGKELYSSSYDHSIRKWDPNVKPTESPKKITLNARAIADAEARKRNGAKVPPPITVEIKTVKDSVVYPLHKEWISTMSISQDESLLISGDDQGNIVLSDRKTGKEQLRWKVKGWVYSVAISPDKNRIFASERFTLVFDSGRHSGSKLYDGTGKLIKDLEPEYKGLHMSSSAFSNDGKYLAIGRGGEADGKIWILNAQDGKKIYELSPMHQYGVTDLAFHPNGKHLLSTGRDTVIRIWDVSSGKLIKELGKPRGGQFKDWLHALSISADGRWVAAADMIGGVQVWELGE